ncbi:hypothetical protein AB0O90_17285 [Microbacterium testaceum]|uniref:hypothetical protein n=1 Tax=Microbacterium testaceum TaxID=2033 RepID=UPI00344769D3
MEFYAEARQVAADLSSRIGREGAEIRNDFIVAPSAEEPPAMTKLLRGGRGGGGVKLKVLLSMLWVAVGEPYDVTEPARVWASLIGLEDPAGRGAARVNAAVRTLTEGGYLRRMRRAGRPSRVYLMNETGSGAEYIKPSTYWAPGAERSAATDERFRYTRLPSEFWVNGWIAALSGSAIAMYLALLQQSNIRGGKTTRHGFWFSPSVASRRYGLTDVTRSKGLRELEKHRLIVIKTGVTGKTLSQWRVRNTYSVDLDRLRETPIPDAVDEPADDGSVS